MHLFEKRERLGWRGLAVSVALFALIALLFVALFNRTALEAESRQTALLEQALRRAAIACYAVEGRYPPTLSHLKQHYGVVIDEEKYIVLYDVFATNVMPGIRVLDLEHAVEEESLDELF